MTLHQQAKLRRIDAACARMNNGLGVVALALTIETGTVAAIRLAELTSAALHNAGLSSGTALQFSVVDR